MTRKTDQAVAFAAFELTSSGIFDEFDQARRFAADLAKVDYTEGLAKALGGGLQELADSGRQRIRRLMNALKPVLCAENQPRVAAEIAAGGLSYLTGLLAEAVEMRPQELSALAHVCLAIGLGEFCSM